MAVTSFSINILQDTIDLSHLSSSLTNYGYEVSLHEGSDQFLSDCRETRYDVIVICGMGVESNNLQLVDVLSSTNNSATPVILIVDNNSMPEADELLKYHINIITFPFTINEFIYRVQVIMRDIETANSMHTSIKNYKNITDNIPAGIVQVDNHGAIIKFNQQFLSIIGMTDIDLRNENFFHLSHPDDYLLERKQLDRLQRKETENVSYEVRLINNEGKTAVCNIAAGVIWERDNFFNSFIFIVKAIK